MRPLIFSRVAYSERNVTLSRNQTLLVVSALLVVFIVVLALNLGGDVFGSRSYHGTFIDDPKDPEQFTLIASDEREISLEEFRGDVVALYFGYTHCPDICPLTLAKLAQAKQELGSQGDDLQVMMITVDPERDSAEILDEYVTRFDPTFLGLTGELEQLEDVASSLGVFFAKQESQGASGYLVDHTASVLVLDREGALRLLLGQDLSADQVAEDLENLLDR